MHPFYKVIFIAAGVFVTIIYTVIIIKGKKDRKKPIETHTASVRKEILTDEPGSNRYDYYINFEMWYDEKFYKAYIVAEVKRNLFYELPDGVTGQLTHQGRLFHKFEYDDMVIEWEKRRYVREFVLRKKDNYETGT